MSRSDVDATPTAHTVAIQDYRDLRVWQSAIELATEVYRVTDLFPRSEQFAIVSQLRRAAVSVAANIAEGHGRSLRQSYRYHVQIARGSVHEIQTLVVVARRVGYIDEATSIALHEQTDHLSRMLHNLRDRLEGRR